ncbi:MAG: C1 family peptidase [Bacteroidaceae bacterium]|nr:C1 family peptidase [Bacteroidaceae bacterium]
MKRSLLLLLLAFPFSMSAQQKGEITNEMLKEIKSGYVGNATDKALLNAISSNDIRKLAVNRENLVGMDTHFSHRVKSRGITNQLQSGRCWLFTGFNVLRAKMMAKHNIYKMEFSQAYSFFWDQLEKSNLFLQGIIDTRERPLTDQMVEWLLKHPLSDGGTYTGVADLVAKYGLVPKEVMPESYNSDNTTRMASLLKEKLREDAMILRKSAESGASQKELQKQKTTMLATIYRMLVLTIGEPVMEFDWAPKDANGKTVGEVKHYTPQSFYAEWIGEDLNADYVMLMNDPSREYWKTYEIDYDRHVYDGHNWLYVNLPVEEIKKMAEASIKDSTMMYFSCDVAKSLDSARGLLDLKNYDYGSLFGTTFGMNKKERIQTFTSGSSHAMTLMAVDIAEDGTYKKWMVENSWGASHGHQGHLIMTEEWFDEFMFRLVVNKKYAPKKVLELLDEKPIRLPAWDPMFAEEE